MHLKMRTNQKTLINLSPNNLQKHGHITSRNLINVFPCSAVLSYKLGRYLLQLSDKQFEKYA